MKAKEALVNKAEELERTCTEKDSLAAKVDMLNGQLAELRNQLAVKDREISQLVAEKSKAIAGENQQKGRAQELDSLLAKKQEELETVKAELRRSQVETERVLGQMKILREELEKVQERNKFLEKENERLELEHAPCAGIIKGLKAQIEALEAKLKEAQKALREALVRAEAAEGKLEGQTEDLEAKLKEALARAEAAERKHAPCDGIIADLRKQIADLQKQIDDLKEQLEKTENIKKETKKVQRSAPIPVAPDREVEDAVAILEWLEDEACLSKKDGAKVQRAAPLQKPGVGVGMLIKKCNRSFVKSGHQSVGKFQIMDVVQGGGAWNTRQIEVHDCIVAVAASPDQDMVVYEDIDLVHDAILGLEGTDLIFQVEKHSNLSLINVKCTRTLLRPQSSNGNALTGLLSLESPLSVERQRPASSGGRSSRSPI